MAKRMVLVDPKLLAGLTQAAPPVTDPVSDVLKQLDTDMESVLNKRDIPLSSKLDQYNEVLTDYLTKVREYKGYSREGGSRQPVTTPPPPPPPLHPSPPPSQITDTEESVEGVGDEGGDGYLSMITDRYKSKAKRMLTFLKSVPNVSWTSRGELKVGDKVIDNSHAVDLLSAATKPVSRAANPPPLPTGWHEFAQVLLQHNAPKDMVGTLMRKEWAGETRTPFTLGIPVGTFGAAGGIDKTPYLERARVARKRRRLDSTPQRPRKSPPQGPRGIRWEIAR